MNTTLQARIGDTHLKKLELIKAKTGLSISFLIRQMIDAAEVRPAEVTVNLSTNANSDGIHQDSTVAVRA